MNQLPQLIDKQTGEIIPIGKVKPKQIREIALQMTDEELGSTLTDFVFARKLANKVEKVLKEIVKNDREISWMNNESTFAEHRLKKRLVKRFNPKRLEAEGSDFEKKQWSTLKKKYTDQCEEIYFG